MDAPEQPDPEDMASTQTRSNVGTARAGSIMNNFNQIGPQGTITYSKARNPVTGKPIREFIHTPDGRRIAIPRYTQTTTLSPEQQRLYDLNLQTQERLGQTGYEQVGKIADLLNDPIDLSSLPERSTDFSADRRRYEDAIFGRLDEQFAKDQEASDARLAAQGVMPGTEAYDRNAERMGDQRTRGRTDAIMAGGQEQARMNAMLEDSRRAMMAEILAGRSAPINEITALMSGSQVSIPQAMQPYRQGVEGVPYGDYVMNNYNQEVAMHNQMMGGLFGLGNSLIGGIFSDERLKEDIEQVGETEAGVPIYKYRYKADPTGTVHMGVMAQELELVNPEAVGEVAGFKTVDYAQVQ